MRIQQSVRYLKTRDGVRLAWATSGSGPALVKAANWLSHLDYDLESPIWHHWIDFLSAHFRLIRYDERGCGMTDWDVADVGTSRWADDLEAVVAASDPGEKFVLFGISQGTAAAVTYAVRHPERVSQLILYGGYPLGWMHREDADGMRRYQAMIDLALLGWGKDNPVFRELFTSVFVPGATREQIDWFNELCRRTTTPKMATRLMMARGDVNVRDLLPQVRVPTLVVHAREDEVVPFSAGKMIASEIPNAEFVQLESRNHILLSHEPAWSRFMDVVLEFTGRPANSGREDELFAVLSEREREILASLVAGRSNTEIGAGLFISEKTVRNSLTRIFEKLGVRTRTQAAVLARDRGFTPHHDRAQDLPNQ
ncbi:MAG TPA: alpha/beta fold hydrolase [Steroidobacteraceae bacterium]|nr:alpha/beta fold hydrolase [Steroidobacteraceae bacterium]